MAWPWEPEEDHLATPAEAVAEFARNIGGEYPDRAWLLHDWDVWVANPHYHGPKMPHPEDYDPYEAEMEAAFGPLVGGFWNDADEPWDTDGDTSRWNENGEASEAENDRYASRSFRDDEIPF